jgi:hypothetical protein
MAPFVIHRFYFDKRTTGGTICSMENITSVQQSPNMVFNDKVVMCLPSCWGIFVH